MSRFKFEDTGFEQTHVHSSVGSLLDGVGQPIQYAEMASRHGMCHLAISDHGMLSAVPELLKAADQYKLFPVIGIELYVNRYQPKLRYEREYKSYVEGLSPEEKQLLKKSYHLLAIAYTNEGYSNLVQIHNDAHISRVGGNPRRPRTSIEVIKSHGWSDGIIFTSCCCLSEIAVAFDRDGPDKAEDILKEYWEAFGDNFYLELMLLDFKKQKPYDQWLVEMHSKLGIPLTISNDVHYPSKESWKSQMHQLLIRGKKTVAQVEQAIANDDTDGFFEIQDRNLYFKSQKEMNEKYELDYSDIIPYELFCQAKANTVKICQKAKGVEIDRSVKLPAIPDADEKLKEEIMKGFKFRGFTMKDKKYVKQMKEEYDLVVRKGFSSYFLIKKMFTDEARRICPSILGFGNGDEAVGPGRGSCPGFLLAFLLRITDIDPLQFDLLSSRFLSDSRGGKKIILPFKSEPAITGLKRVRVEDL